VLGPGRYLLGVVEILLLVGFAGLGATALRRRLLPRFEGAPALLATAVLALALLIWPAELLGTIGAFEALPYLLLVAIVSLLLWRFLPRESGEWNFPAPTLIALFIGGIAVLHFAIEVKTRLSTGMTGFDTTWYHGPFAAGFFQSGDTWDLHFIAPQFLAWFYPANGEIFHAVGMLAFDRDVLSPLLNLGWFAGCLLACWCIGRPYRLGPWSLALGAIALSVPALADQAGEARNDIVGIFFLLAAVAVALNGERDARTAAVAGLAAGLAAGTKLNFLLPAAVLVIGLAAVAPRGIRWSTLVSGTLAAVAGGGYWYLRNLAHSGNPLPWIQHLGPIDLPAPDQALGGREAHSVLGYLTDGGVWSDWFLPGLHDGLWLLWPLLLLAAAVGLVLCLLWGTQTQRVAACVGLAAAAAWLVAPTSASGPDGMPRGFESGLRYLAPALVLGLALLPTALHAREVLRRPRKVRRTFASHSGEKVRRTFCWGLAGLTALAALCVLAGYPVQRHYLEGRYADPSFTTPGLNSAFAWARDVSDSRIATTSTRQYPLFGTDLSNQVEYLGIERPHGGFEPPAGCRAFLLLLAEGDYDYVVASRDRLEAGKPPYPPSAQWTARAGGSLVLRKPPTVVFKLPDNPRPSACR
jgi:hypothetical protein